MANATEPFPFGWKHTDHLSRAKEAARMRDSWKRDTRGFKERKKFILEHHRKAVQEARKAGEYAALHVSTAKPPSPRRDNHLTRSRPPIRSS